MAFRPYIKNADGSLTDIPLQAEVAVKLGTLTKGNDLQPIFLSNGVPTLCRNIVDLIYPVGSIYMSVGATNPQVLFGGTWEQLKDRFLIGAGNSYTQGQSGGEAMHTLTESEMPSHTHGLSSSNAGSHNDDYTWVKPLGNNAGGGAVATGIVAEVSCSGLGSHRYVNSYGSAYGGQIVQSIGGGGAHNNMPPYLAVNIWKRIS